MCVVRVKPPFSPVETTHTQQILLGTDHNLPVYIFFEMTVLMVMVVVVAVAEM